MLPAEQLGCSWKSCARCHSPPPVACGPPKRSKSCAQNAVMVQPCAIAAANEHPCRPGPQMASRDDGSSLPQVCDCLLWDELQAPFPFTTVQLLAVRQSGVPSQDSTRGGAQHWPVQLIHYLWQGVQAVTSTESCWLPPDCTIETASHPQQAQQENVSRSSVHMVPCCLAMLARRLAFPLCCCLCFPSFVVYASSLEKAAYHIHCLIVQWIEFNIITKRYAHL